MGVITLLRLSTFVGDTGQTLLTDWISFPPDHQIAQLVVVVHSRTGTSSVAVRLQGTWDTAAVLDLGSVINTGAPTAPPTTQDLTTNLPPMVRLSLSSVGATASVVISVYLTPKSN